MTMPILEFGYYLASTACIKHATRGSGQKFKAFSQRSAKELEKLRDDYREVLACTIWQFPPCSEDASRLGLAPDEWERFLRQGGWDDEE